MRTLALLLVAVALAGCVTASGGGELSSQQEADYQAERQQIDAAVKAHKIGFAEASRRSNAALERIAQGQLTDDDQLLMTFRVALSTEIDAGRLTPEMALYQYREKASQLQHVRRQELLEALAVASR